MRRPAPQTIGLTLVFFFFLRTTLILGAIVTGWRSNGLAEKGVDIAKKGIEKSLHKSLSNANAVEEITLKEASVILHKFLFNYWNTPSVDLNSPNDLLFPYKPTTMLTTLLPNKVRCAPDFSSSCSSWMCPNRR